ncbi:MAG: hypothetical protein AAGI23_01380 [Bacteroidota bacterium]
MKNLLLTLGLILTFLITANAQRNYDTAIGARLGYPISLSLKRYISDAGAIEANLGFRGNVSYNWIVVSGAYLHHKSFNIDELPSLNWYYGGGASVYFWSYDTDFLRSQYGSTTIGLQGYLGVEYTFSEAPINITLDWVPTIFVNGFTSGFGGRYGSLGIRYVLGRN